MEFEINSVCAARVESITFIDTEKFPYLNFFDDSGKLNSKALRGPKSGDGNVEVAFSAFSPRPKSFHTFATDYPDIESLEVKLRDSAAISSMRLCFLCT